MSKKEKDISNKSLTIAIKVIPKSSHNAIVGWINGELKVRLAAIPAKGDANRELIYYFAKILGIAKSQIQILSGQTNPHKKIRIGGLDSETFERLISKVVSN